MQQLLTQLQRKFVFYFRLAIINLLLCRHFGNNSVRLFNQSSFRSNYCYFFSKAQFTFPRSVFIRHFFFFYTLLQTIIDIRIVFYNYNPILCYNYCMYIYYIILYFILLYYVMLCYIIYVIYNYI